MIGTLNLYRNGIKSGMRFLEKNKYHKHNVGSDTLANDLCVGCGVCAAICPNKCIKMNFTEMKEWRPNINEVACSECGLCVVCCPHSSKNLSNDIEKITSVENPEYYSISGCECYVAYDKKDENRKRSASGGAVTAILMELIKNNYVDAVVHMKRAWDYIGGIHYKADISYSEQELDLKRSSAYYALCFADILSTIKQADEPKRYVFVGGPCVINAIVRLFNHFPFNKNKIFTIALMCSHNVNGQFVDFLAESNKISRNHNFKVNLRDNEGIRTAYDYKNAFEFSDRIVRFDRFSTAYTTTWRNCFFAYNACFFCPDFYGAYADISVKDAWAAKWALNPLGSSMLVIRNQELAHTFKQMNSIFYERISPQILYEDQKISPILKHKEIVYRLHLNKAFKTNISWISLRKNLKNNIYKYYYTAKLSKILYCKTGYIGIYPLYIISSGPEKVKKIFLRIKNKLKKIVKKLLVTLGIDRLKSKVGK